MSYHFFDEKPRQGFFDRPGSTEMMLALGAGLAQAAYAPPGQSGWAQAPQALLQALQARQYGARNAMEAALYKQKMDEAERERRVRAGFMTDIGNAQQGPVEGLPWTNSPYAGMDKARLATAARLAELDPKAGASFLGQPEPFHAPVQALDPATGRGRFVSPQQAVSTGAEPFREPKNPIFEDRPLPGDMIQKEASFDQGRTWEKRGEPYSRREPYIIQEVRGEDGVVRQLAIPRSSIGQAPDRPAGSAASPDVPAGAKVLSESKEKPTDQQSLAAGFATRMSEAEAELDRLTKEGYDPTLAKERVGEAVPAVGNYLVSADFQRMRQAQADWVRAKLRKESGAVIADDEMKKEIETYFPRPGDKPEVIAQKQRARGTATKAMEFNAGSALKKVPPKEPKKAPTRLRFDAQGNSIP